jgi:hypothetical protein
MRKISFVHQRAGNVALFFGLGAPVVGALMGVAVDFSDATRLKAELQLAADNAALAGALAYDSPSATEATVAKTATDVINARVPLVQKAIKPLDAEKTVVVDLSWNKPLYFGGLIGLKTYEVAVEAKAVNAGRPTPCVLALGPDEPVGIGARGLREDHRSEMPGRIQRAERHFHRHAGRSQDPRRRGVRRGGTGKASTSPPAQPCKTAPDPYESRNLNPKRVKLPVSVGGPAPTYTGPCNFTNKVLDSKDKGANVLLPGVYCGACRSTRPTRPSFPGSTSSRTVLGAGRERDPQGLGRVHPPLGNRGGARPAGKSVAHPGSQQDGLLGGLAIASDTPASPSSPPSSRVPRT